VPKRKDIKKILIIGSGPIIIGQACEFDYSGAQACKACSEEQVQEEKSLIQYAAYSVPHRACLSHHMTAFTNYFSFRANDDTLTMRKRTAVKRMVITGFRPLVALLGCLVIAGALFSRPSVEVLMPQPSSQNPKIIVLHDGTPLQNAEIHVSTVEGETRASLATDEHGAVVLPRLRPGRYTIAANAPGNLQAYLLLDISKPNNKKPSEFSMQLRVGPPSLEERIVAAEAEAAPEQVREFSGTVVDPSGAEIPKVKVAIYQRGSSGKTLVSTASTDANGRFAPRLPNGTYTAIFQAPGFAIRIYVFEVNKDSTAKKLLMRLDVGAVC